jgi:hypothetical protein
MILFKINKDIYFKNGDTVYKRYKGVINYSISKIDCISDFIDNINSVETNYTLQQIIQILKEIKE